MSWFTRHDDTPQPVPRWPAQTLGPRVLLEVPDPGVSDILARDLGARGYAVLTCSGPDPQARGAVTCPVLRQEPCPAVRDADLVVSALPLTRPACRVLLRRVARDGQTPLVLAAPQHVVDQHGDGLAAQQLHPLSAEGVVEAAMAVGVT